MNHTLKTLILLLISCNFTYGQKPSPTIDSLMTRDFPVNSREDGRWVYFSNSAAIKHIEQPMVQQMIPKYSFYEMELTNFLGYHMNKSHCLVLIDSVKSKTLLVTPMWYSDINEDFLKLFIGKQFADSAALMQFTTGLQELMLIGSSGSFETPVYASDKIAFDYTYDAGASDHEIWRHIEIILDNNKIKRFTSTNPKMNETATVR
ncbi:MAG: hypothetical protein V4604_09220 [Bacteroidota bacterium]